MEQKSQENFDTEHNLGREGILAVVGIGASAGGLEALQDFVANIPVDTRMSFVIAQHSLPSSRSMLVDLLGHTSTLPVYHAKHYAFLKINSIYVCPPDYNIEINKENQIILTKTFEDHIFPQPSVNILFESLALHKRDKSIGIVLSGTGTDGTRGIHSIKANGGFAIVQDPNSAKFDGMPNSAISLGVIDLILAPEDMGNELLNLTDFTDDTLLQLEVPLISREIYNKILNQLKRHKKVDFSLYKESTILRRIERRMAALKIKEVYEYYDRLKEDNSEVVFLFNDILIGVTSFFRDDNGFDFLKSHTKNYLHNKKEKSIRIWVAACSTGEEAYSIAMMLFELLGDEINEYKIQIFATDVDKYALDIARNGVYSSRSILNVSDECKKNIS